MISNCFQIILNHYQAIQTTFQPLCQNVFSDVVCCEEMSVGLMKFLLCFIPTFFLQNFVSIFVAVNTTSTDRPDGNEHHVSSQQETNAGKHGEFLLYTYLHIVLAYVQNTYVLV